MQSLLPSVMPVVKNRVVGVLEDETDIGDLIVAALSTFGFEPHRIESVSDALALVRDRGAATFILDVQVNSRSLGLDVLEELKSLDPNIFVCIYSGYVEKAVRRHRADRLRADFVQSKTILPRADLCVIAREVLRHDMQLARFELELIEVELARVREAAPPLVNWETRAVNPEVLTVYAPKPESHVAASSSILEDENVQLFERLCRDEHWRQNHVGTAVAIIDGVVVAEAGSLDEVLTMARTMYPKKSRFGKVVESSEEVFDIPTPFDVEDQ
jgi:RNase P protein component